MEHGRYDPGARITDLRDRLAQETDPAERVSLLADLGLVIASSELLVGPGAHEGRFAHGGAAALHEATEALSTADRRLPADDPRRPAVTARLGVLLGLRHFAFAGPVEDRERSITLLRRLLPRPGVSEWDRETARLWLGQFLVFRAVPGGLRLGQAPDLAAVAGLVTGADAARSIDGSDLAEAIGHLGHVMDSPIWPEETKNGARALLAMAMLLNTLNQAGSPDLDPFRMIGLLGRRAVDGR